MSIHTLERAIWRAAQVTFNNPKLRLKDLREWSTGRIYPEDDEVVEFVEDPGVYVSVLKEHDKR